MIPVRASVFIATSLDGFIARENGDIDWLPVPDSDSAEDYGYREFIGTVDALVIGRHSYEKVLTFGVWPYGNKRVVVLSRREIALRADLSDTVEWMSGAPEEILQRLGERGVRHVYVDGGRTIQRFLDAGLIQRMVITRIPVLIGKGIPLFGPLRRDVKLSHVATRSYPDGLVQSEYVPAGKPEPAE